MPRRNSRAYGVQPDWFGLGDRDLATHLVRSQMLRAGYPLSQVTEALCDRWQPGARLLPASDDRCETHVVITDPDDGRADGRSTSRSGGCATAPRCPRTASRSSAPKRPPRQPGVAEAIARRRRRAAGAVQPGGEHRRDPGRPRHPRRAAVDVGPVVGYSPIIGGKPLRGMADECLSVIGVASTSEAVGGTTGRARAPASWTAGWCTRAITPRSTGVDGAVGAAADDRSGGDGRDGARRTRPCGGEAVTEHRLSTAPPRRSRSCP